MFEGAGLRLEFYELELAGARRQAGPARRFFHRTTASGRVRGGMAALREHADREDPQQIVEHIHFFVFGD
jgi:hypothetical protein